MSGNSTYFFPPAAQPTNPWYGERQVALQDIFGRANAAAFDRRGFAYFNRNVYDLFYPGYMDGWPTGHGALGMTFEQASARALVLRRDDGDLLTYGDGVLHHFTAAITTAETAARNRERILRGFLDFRREGIEMGQEGAAELVCSTSAPRPGRCRAAGSASWCGTAIRVRSVMGPVSVGRSGRFPARGTLRHPSGPAGQPNGAQPAGQARAHGSRFRPAADRAPCRARARRDLRPDGMEPVPPLGRGGHGIVRFDGRRRSASGRRARSHAHHASPGYRGLPHAVGHHHCGRRDGGPPRRDSRPGRRGCVRVGGDARGVWVRPSSALRRTARISATPWGASPPRTTRKWFLWTTRT